MRKCLLNDRYVFQLMHRGKESSAALWKIVIAPGLFLRHFQSSRGGTNLMALHTAHAELISELIREGHHKTFHALACPIGPSRKHAD